VPGEPLRIADLIDSVADGTPVDWDAVARIADGNERRAVGHLRVVAAVAELHRTMLVAEEDEAENRVETRAEPDADSRVWGHLRLVEKVGEGAFGEVYRAHDAWLDREVALKLLKPAPGRQPVARVIEEAQTLARVRHHNVVTVHGAAIHNGRAGLWMEYVEGRSLAEIVSATGPMSGGEAALVGQEICSALSAVHARTLVHRDVKAQNVMRESGGRVVLMDFGAGGTPLYLAPELLRGDEPSVQSDLYAVGVLLYYLVTGRFPAVPGGAAGERLGTPKRLVEHRQDLPEPFVGAVERALATDRSQRFATAREMQEALSNVAPKLPPKPARFNTASALALATGVFLIAAVVGLLFRSTGSGRGGGPASRVEVLTVLPFDNVSSSDGERTLATGVAMELTARLGELSALRVVPWTFARQFTPGTASLQEIARRTGADAIVEGSVQLTPPAGESEQNPRVRVRVQIYHAGSGSLMWTSAYERDVEAFLSLQAEIASAIARHVNIAVGRHEAVRLHQGRRVAADAMESYLRARELLDGKNDIRSAMQLFAEATERDASFAEAFAGLANCHALQAAYLAEVPADVALERALRASARAIDIDGSMAEPYAVRGFAHLALDWNWQAAGDSFKQALKLGPNVAAVFDQYSNFLTVLGRHDEAIAAARRAEERAPLSAAYSRTVAWALYMARRYGEALVQLDRTIEIEPGFEPARTLRGRVYLLTGRPDEALREFESTRWMSMAAVAHARAGRGDEARAMLTRIGGRGEPRRTTPYDMAIVYASLGEEERALDELEKAFETRDTALAHIAVDPLLDPLRTAPRFARTLQRMALTP